MLSRKVLFCASFAIIAGCSCGYAGSNRGKDFYPDMEALKAGNVEGRDYSIESYDRKSSVTVFAIHGGDVELGTARLARRIAGKDLNLYIFSGWLGAESGRLHITSTRFDDPEALRLAASGVLGVSIHAQAVPEQKVCVGGGNSAAAGLVASRLKAAGFSAEAPCVSLPGVSPRNLINRAAKGGVQLEISLPLLERLESSTSDLSEFTEAVRSAVLEYLRNL